MTAVERPASGPAARGVALAFTAAVLGLAGPAAAQRKERAPKDDFGITLEPKVRLSCQLLAKSKTPDPKALELKYDEGLVVYEYKVLQALQGSAPGPKVRVTHLAVRRKLIQPVTGRKVGDTFILCLVPWAEVQPKLKDVCISETLPVGDLPMFHDVGQQVLLPVDERGRWNYAVDIGGRLKPLIVLRNQLKLVVVGDCQAWFANNTEQYYGQENKRTPVALGVWQEREGLQIWKPFVEDYLVHLPKLEWVVLMWNPRYVNATWTYGAKAAAFLRSGGYQYDKQRAAEVFKPVAGPPLTTEQVLANPLIGGQWRRSPYNEIRGVKFGRSARGEALSVQRKFGTYRFDPANWALLESIARTLAQRKVKLLVVMEAVHPETAHLKVKDKSGVDEAGYKDQVARLKAMENKYPGLFFCYDFNNGGDNGLADEDFGNIDHPTQTGAVKITRAIEAYRLKIEQELRGTAKR